MEEQIKFEVFDGFFSGSNPDAELLKAALHQNLKSIEQLLVSYHFKSRGRVFDVAISEGSIEFIKPLMAKFIVNYAIGQFNACADLDFNDKAAMEMLVDIDSDQKAFIVTGEYVPERDPDEF
jgi:hypothetical protein